MTTMRISQLAERSGVPATTLRFYETSGLLTAERSEAGYRLYGEEAVRRLAFIGGAKRLGLPLEEIAELLAVWESGACAEVKGEVRPRVARRLAEAEMRAGELAAFGAVLRGVLDHLDALPERAERCDEQCAALLDGEPVPTTTTTTTTHTPRSALPVACTLSGDGMRERLARWRDVLDGATRTPIRGGLRLTVPVDRVADVAGLAADEQGCCAFFDFRLHLDAPDLHLEVRAPEAAGGLLAELFESPA